MIINNTHRPYHGPYPVCGRLDTLPKDALRVIVGNLRLDALITLVSTSKGLRQRLEEPDVRPGLIDHLPTIHRTWAAQQDSLVEVIEEVWWRMGCIVLGDPESRWNSERKSESRIMYANPMYDVCKYPFADMGVLWDAFLQRTLRQRLGKLELALGVDGTSNTSVISRNLIEECIAIEKLLAEYSEFVQAPGRTEFRPFEDLDDELDAVGPRLLRLKEHFSPRLFCVLLRYPRRIRYDLVHDFFWLINRCTDQEKNRGLARFLVKNCDGFLLGMDKDQLAKIEGLLGAEVEGRSTDYKIFGSRGLGDTWIADDEPVGFNNLSVSAIDPTSAPPDEEDVQDCYELLCHLVRLSKYVFTDADELKKFLLWVSREACTTILLRRLKRQELSTELYQETTARFENIIEGIVTQAIADDTTPFCAHTEFEQNTKFVYGGLGPYLVRECTKMEL